MRLVTCPGFEPGACIYLAAFTTESCQLVMLPTGPGHVFTQAGDYDRTDGKEMYCMAKGWQKMRAWPN